MKKILLEAPILTNSGYGEHARLVFRSIQNLASDYDIYINPLRWGSTSWSSDVTLERSLIDACILKNARYNKASSGEPVYDIQIHVGIPNEFSKKAPYSICVTAGIETDRVSSEWIIKTTPFSKQGKIDKLIVPSTHSKQSFADTKYSAQTASGKTIDLKLDCPIEVVPYPVKTFETIELENLSLNTKFNFLTVSMWGIRKNMENTIKWFIDEFREDADVGLIIKTNLSKNSIIDRVETVKKIGSILNQAGNRKCKVHILHGYMSPRELHALYKHPNVKAYLSATHGEGYGLPIFEAAYSGLPVIATDWSAHLDFLSAPIRDKKTGNKKIKKVFARVDYTMKQIQKEAVWENILIESSRWAFPKENSFKQQIRKVYKQYGFYKKRAQILKQHLLVTHDEQKVYDQMAMALLSGCGLKKESLKVHNEWSEQTSRIEKL